MTKRPFLTFGKPDISEREIEAVTKVLRSGWIGTGRVAREFEDEVCRFLGIGNAVAVSSATMGLILTLRAEGIGPGDKVITTPMTFAATVNAILSVGATPVFADVLLNGCINPESVREKIDDETKAIMPVHYTGISCEMDEIMAIAKEAHLIVIEDAAHGFGGEYVNGVPRKIGTMGDYGVFSFYATKNITAGEGGMVVTKDPKRAEIVRIFSQQGQSSGAWGRYKSGPISRYEVTYDGHKGNLPDLLAAVGLAQLQRFAELKEKRNRVWSIYEKAFGTRGVGHSQHLFTIDRLDRDTLREYLWAARIGTGIHYTPLHLEPAYQFMESKKGDFPVAEYIGERTVSLPVSPTMTKEDAEYVVENVTNFISKADPVPLARG